MTTDVITQWGIRFSTPTGTHELWLDETRSRLIASGSPMKIKVIYRHLRIVGATSLDRPKTERIKK